MIFGRFHINIIQFFPAEFLRRKIAFVIVFKYRHGKKRKQKSYRGEITIQISEVNLKVEEIKTASIVASF
jgi:hypothetical protein